MTDPLDYLSRGWAIHPCHSFVNGACTCGNDCGKNAGKHPRTTNGVKDATHDSRVVQTWIERWGAENINWALACGQDSGVVAIDIDPSRGGFESMSRFQQDYGLLPATLTSITGGGGYHLIYQIPPDLELSNRQDVLPGVDVRGHHGYILLPPARHRSGAVYAFREVTDVTPIPDTLRQLAVVARAPDVQLDLSSMAPIPEGNRNDTLFRKACQLRRQTRDDRVAVEATVRAYNAFLCQPPLDEYDIKKLIDSAFVQDHTEPELPEWNPILDDTHPRREWTDTGNGLRLIDYHGIGIRYSQGIGWWTWAGNKWHADQEAQQIQEYAKGMCEFIRAEADALRQMATDQNLVNLALRWSTESQSAGHVGSMIKLATSDPRTLTDVDRFDEAQFLLGCRNGVLDLLTGELRPHVHSDLITQCTNIDYEPNYRLQEWDDFLWSSCEGDQELIDYLQRAVGYTLTGSTEAEAFFIITGPSASGKSTFIDAIMTALGDYAGQIATETIVLSHNTSAQGRRESDLARVFGKRLIATSEIPDGSRLDESTVKQLTGGDQVSARHLYKNPFSYKPRFKLWIATNYAPTINDQAMWRRVKRIPFNHKLPFNERDPKMKQILSDPQLGGKAVLTWAVEGTRQWYMQGLNEPSRITVEVHEYAQDQDRLADFIHDRLIEQLGMRTQVLDVYASYTGWCAGIGERPISRQRLVEKLRERGCLVQRMNGTQWLCDYTVKMMTAEGMRTAWG